MSEEFDEIEMEILDDGSVKFTTDKISPVNHGDAEELLRLIQHDLPGKSQRIKMGQSAQKQKQKLKQ